MLVRTQAALRGFAVLVAIFLSVSACERAEKAYVVSANDNQMVSLTIVRDTKAPIIQLYVDTASPVLFKSGRNALATVSEQEIDCAAKSRRDLNIWSQDADGRLTPEPVDQSFRPVVPGTIGAKILAVACNKGARTQFEMKHSPSEVRRIFREQISSR